MPWLGLGTVLLGFLAGSVPWGYVAGIRAKGIDLRTVGSGGTGATNVLRTLGRKASAVVLILDFLKGLLPVLLALSLGVGPLWASLTAVATVVGHCWSPFIGFKGGKGMATGAGATIALFPPVLIALPVVIGAIWASRYVSLGSLLGALSATGVAVAAAATGRLSWTYAVAVAAISLIIIWRHRENIDRLRRGTERKFGERLPS